MDRGGLLEALREATQGDYQIIRELGRGGMATVFHAHDLRLGRDVAVKVMFPNLMGDEDAPRRFQQEARTSAGLDHPNIIPIYSVHAERGLLYFVMKYVEGKALDEVVKDMGKLPIPLVREILRRVAGALEYAHGRGVVHRDIKPGNIMIDTRGTPIVMDFGIAKVPQLMGLTRPGDAIGTPRYMSPEQFQGGDLGGASDQYSLGLVAYELLTGQVPFDAPSIGALMYKQLNEAPQPIGEVRPDCPDALRMVVDRMLAKEPSDRWPSMHSVVSAVGGAAPTVDTATRTALISMAGLEGSHSATMFGQPAPNPTPPPFEPVAVEPQEPEPPARLHTRPTTGSRLEPEPLTPAPGLPAREPPGPKPALPIPQPTPVPRAKANPRLLWGAIAVAIVLVGGFALSSVLGGGPPTIIENTSVGAIELSPSQMTVAVLDTFRLSALARDGTGAILLDAEPTWSTQDSGVARVASDGLITALSEGTARISASVGDVTAAATVLVTSPEPPPPVVARVTVDPNRLALLVGGRQDLTATPVDGSGSAVQGQPIEWLVEDPGVARIEERSGGAQVIGISTGTTSITARSGGAQSPSVSVTISRPTVAPAPETVAGVTVEPGSLALDVGQSSTLRATVQGTRTAELSRPVAWRSSAPDIVSVDQSGNVRALSDGSAQITATSENRSATVGVSVAAPVVPPPVDAVAVSSITGGFEVDRDGQALLAVFTLVSTGQSSAWCADLTYQKDGEVLGSRREPFQVGAGATPTVLRLPLTFDDLGLARRGSGSARITGSVRVWATECGPSTETETPLGTGATAPVCLRRLALQSWFEDPCEG